MKHAIVIVNERLAERLQFIALEGLMLMARSRDDSGPGGMAGERVGRSSYRLGFYECPIFLRLRTSPSIASGPGPPKKRAARQAR